ncbi:MAG: DUF2188 domain-containing protein [Flavisolibacter sp.]|nr:DUF2188 domain-containing protein [Flavisolibacter sp.]MBA3968412.1 DUF2188 domain-containing protein [Nitrospirales bacterium]
MTKKRDIHVVPHDDFGWATRLEGDKQVSSRHRTQEAAIDEARGVAKKDHIEVVIHRPDGRIRDSDSYGNDPHPPKDRKH